MDAENKAAVMSALAEAVALGLDQGWKRIHQAIRQPSKAQLLAALNENVMVKISNLLEEHKK